VPETPAEKTAPPKSRPPGFRAEADETTAIRHSTAAAAATNERLDLMVCPSRSLVT
jgi:hypothetical protein